jgi:hypothetical protein
VFARKKRVDSSGVQWDSIDCADVPRVALGRSRRRLGKVSGSPQEICVSRRGR